MLYFVYTDLALGYLILSFLSALGVLQIVAARYQLAGLALLKYSTPRRRAYAMAMGSFLVAASSVLFFATQWAHVLTPGPAGSELALLFGIGAACATTVVLSAATLRLRRINASLPGLPQDDRGLVTVGGATGRVHAPSDPGAPMAAVCLIGGPDDRYQAALAALAHQLVQSQMLALLITPERGLFTYPDVLALLPAASALLSKLPELDPQRIGALGYGLGGDLVMRAASGDRQLKAVVALAPLLGGSGVGIELMHELSFPAAWRWARDEQRLGLQSTLNALDYAQAISPRPLLLVYGASDWLVDRLAPGTVNEDARRLALLAQESVTVTTQSDVGHFDLLDSPSAVQAVVQWLEEHL